MMDPTKRAVAVVGIGAIMPDALTADTFWENILHRCYSIRETPLERWSIDRYYDPDPSAPDKTYSKIGGWVQGYQFDWKSYRIPPKVAAVMDESQKWALTCASSALEDYGYPQRPLDKERLPVVLGTAMGGEMHYLTYLRLSFPEYAHYLNQVQEFKELPKEVRQRILEHWQRVMDASLPPVTEDSMPGELANIVSGRVANVLNLRGGNFITDAACASSLAAVQSAVDLLLNHQADAVLTGGVDHNMGASSFIKFCKIGALSATGSRPFGKGADGFVMGEGAAVFLLKRLEDAERAGDRIYAVIRGIGSSSDGRGKGITAPNPAGQKLAIERAWEEADLDPTTATLIEAHGTSTKVGDAAEYETLAKIFDQAPQQGIALGSVKSNIGHLKAAAGGAGLIKAVLALHHKILPPTLNADPANPDIDFQHSPFYLNHEIREWAARDNLPRRCGVSAYGFGGTNFHLVLEEYLPGKLTTQAHVHNGISLPDTGVMTWATPMTAPMQVSLPIAVSPVHLRAPLRGILVIGGNTLSELKEQFNDIVQDIESGWMPAQDAPTPAELVHPERLVVDYGSREELIERLKKAEKALELDSRPAWAALQAQGIFRGHGVKSGQLAFLFPGQGSQYVNMGYQLARISPTVAEVFEQADRVMKPILGKPLTHYIFVDSDDPKAIAQAEKELMQTSITQPAVLTLDIALYQLLAGYGFQPDLVMGHSLGEYAALVAAGIMPFEDVLEAAAARGREMSKVQVEDNGWMAAIMAPLQEVEQTLKEIDGYTVIANINSYNQSVIGGDSRAVEKAIEVFQKKGYQAQRLPVSHAFHTRIVAPASGPLRQVLNRLHVSAPQLPMVGNVTGEFYPRDPESIKDLLERQIASPVQWIKGLETLYTAGGRAFVEVGPKKALKGFVDDVLGKQEDLISLFSNHPKTGELASFNQALCGLYAAGYASPELRPSWPPEIHLLEPKPAELVIRPETVPSEAESQPESEIDSSQGSNMIDEIVKKNGKNGHSDELIQALLMKTLDQITERLVATQPGATNGKARAYDRNDPPLGSIVISGTGLGLPGVEKHVMDPENAVRILRGEQFVDLLPERFRKKMLAKQITRLVKSEDGSGRFEVIGEEDEVIKLAGRPGYFDLTEEYGVPAKLVEALDTTTQLAMAAGIDALREAGIPLVQTYKHTSTGKYLPDRWLLPEALRDETGVIFASAFPGGDRFADEFERYYTWENRKQQLQMLEEMRRCTEDPGTLTLIGEKMRILREALDREPYAFDRRFLFRILSMGHSQFAEYIGARGPNTQVNAACSSTPQAISIAEDWIQSGRCRRILVVAADNVSGGHLLEWVGAGFLATGAAATDDRVEDACIPFDRRRHGMVVGMGACALVVESEDAVRERGMRGIVELLASETANSAFHGTRLDPPHIAQVMNSLVSSAERRFGLDRRQIAGQMVFMSHETYTPARGGSASAEVVALQETFGEAAKEIVVANTKGFTGHAMGVGVEDVIAIKILEYGIVPPVPNFKEIDDDLGPLNLSRGGRYPVSYALHLSAGFGSQIAMDLIRRIPGKPDRIDEPARYHRWLADVSGYAHPELEVVLRNLRIKSEGPPQNTPIGSAWKWGTGPIERTAVSHQAQAISYQPSAISYRKMDEAQSSPSPISLKQKTIQVEPEVIKVQPIKESTQPIAENLQAEEKAESRELKAESSLSPSPLSPQKDVDPIAQAVLEIVASKTGYPMDMLDLDLDMEADLGIDTVKQAETFLAIRTKFDIPQQENLKLRDYPTIGHAIQFVKKMRGEEGISSKLYAISSQEPSPEPQPLSVMDKVEKAEELTAYSLQPTASTPLSPHGDSDPIIEAVLDIVAEKTGYPKEMLELDLDMEADLGIDTVKQAETFLAIRTKFDIPKQEDLKLRDYPTIGHAVEFVKKAISSQQKERNDQQTGEKIEQEIKGEELKAESRELMADSSLSPIPLELSNRFPRRVPKPILRPALELFKPTGVALEVGNRVVVGMDQGGISKVLVEALGWRNATALPLDTSLPAEEIEAQVKAWLAEGPIQGVYWLPALDVEPELDRMDLDAWKELNRVRVKNLYTVMRALYESVNQPGTFLVSATRLGGLFGYGEEAASAPLGGAVCGFTKAYKREQPAVLVKVVDFEVEPLGVPDIGLFMASKLINETLNDPGVMEIGYWEDYRWAIGLGEEPVQVQKAETRLTPGSVYVVTGAAGSITSAIIADLAAESRGGQFYLLDLVPQPDPQDERIQLFRKDKESLKKRLIDEARQAGEKPKPAQIDKRVQEVERLEAALRAIETIQATGGKASYHCVNLLNGPAVAEVIDQVRKEKGRIDVMIHAGGLEISRALPDKDQKQFDLVFDVKADGFFNLLKAATGIPIGAVIAFSSVAGRFGNSGQTDYSAANDLLCKITSHLHRFRPDTQAIVIDWTAWSGIGMATRGSIPKIMEAAGIDMLPPEVGIPTIRRELGSGKSGEVVIADRLGVMTAEWDETGGLDPKKSAHWLGEIQPKLLMVSALTKFSLEKGLEIETNLDPKAQPFLNHHRIDGTAVLPGVMVTETFAEAAWALAHMGMQNGSAYTVKSVENELFLAPFKFYKDQPQILYISVTARPAGHGELLAHAELRSRRAPAREGLPSQEKLHFSADIRLTRQTVERPAIEFNLPCAEWQLVTAEQLYRTYFHGPAYQVIESVRICPNEAIGLYPVKMPPDTDPDSAAHWMQARLIELCFQTAGAWELTQKGRMALPTALESVTVYPLPEGVVNLPTDRRIYALVEAIEEGKSFNAIVMNDCGEVYLQLIGYQTISMGE